MYDLTVQFNFWGIRCTTHTRRLSCCLVLYVCADLCSYRCMWWVISYSPDTRGCEPITKRRREFDNRYIVLLYNLA